MLNTRPPTEPYTAKNGSSKFELRPPAGANLGPVDGASGGPVRRRSIFWSFPYVCPESVLQNFRFMYKWLQKTVFRSPGFSTTGIRDHESSAAMVENTQDTHLFVHVCSKRRLSSAIHDWIIAAAASVCMHWCRSLRCVMMCDVMTHSLSQRR